MIFDRVTDIHFEDVYVRLNGFRSDIEVFLKLESFNLAGSIKLKTAIAMVDAAESTGQLAQHKTRIVESSSGNLGVALALLSMERGYRFTCVVDPNLNELAARQIQAFGGELVQVTDRDSRGGFLGSRIQKVRELLEEDGNAVWLNQYANVANAEAHYRLTAPAVFRQFPTVSHIFVGAGSCGTLMGFLKYTKVNGLQTKVIAVDATGSATFGSPPAERRIPGIGASRRPEIADLFPVSDVVWIDEQDAIRQCRALLAERALLCGGSTGSVVAAIKGSRNSFAPGSIIVGISADSGTPYLGTVFSDEWVNSNMLEVRQR